MFDISYYARVFISLRLKLHWKTRLFVIRLLTMLDRLDSIVEYHEEIWILKRSVVYWELTQKCTIDICYITSYKL